MAPTPVLLPGKSHGWRSLVGCSTWGREESDMTEWLHFHFSLSCIGEGNGNPLQCSCLENPRNRGAWWAAIYGVAQSRTQLKWLSSSSSVKEAKAEVLFLSYTWGHWAQRVSTLPKDTRLTSSKAGTQALFWYSGEHHPSENMPMIPKIFWTFEMNTPKKKISIYLLSR